MDRDSSRYCSAFTLPFASILLEWVAKRTGWYKISLTILVLSICTSIYTSWLAIGVGEYKLTEQFSSLHIQPDEVNLISTASLEDIIDSLKNGISISNMADVANKFTDKGQYYVAIKY